jgi:DNA polymerase alpha-associated DNA helicase A
MLSYDRSRSRHWNSTIPLAFGSYRAWGATTSFRTKVYDLFFYLALLITFSLTVLTSRKVRLGHPARLLPSVLNHSLDVLTQTSDAAAIVKDVRREMDTKQASIRKTKSGRERKAIYSDLKELRKEFREREKKCVGTLIGGSKVVLATLHGAGGFQLKNEDFDTVIIDEASQALEAQCWVPLVRAKKVVLAGDHLQLPPTIKSLNSKTKIKMNDQKGILKGMTLETTLFDRLLKMHGPGIKRMLTIQYRMHEKIMRFPSDELYGSKLEAAEAVKARLLLGLPYEVEETEDTIEPLIFFDTQGGDFPEKSEDDVDQKVGKGMTGESKSNEMEASLVKEHLQNLVNAGVRPGDIAVVTPYNAQVINRAKGTLMTIACFSSTHEDDLLTSIACSDISFVERRFP